MAKYFFTDCVYTLISFKATFTAHYFVFQFFPGIIIGSIYISKHQRFLLCDEPKKRLNTFQKWNYCFIYDLMRHALFATKHTIDTWILTFLPFLEYVLQGPNTMSKVLKAQEFSLALQKFTDKEWCLNRYIVMMQNPNFVFPCLRHLSLHCISQIISKPLSKTFYWSCTTNTWWTIPFKSKSRKSPWRSG